nr:hypothetical protein [Tanacetum cinerariifolium]
DLFLAGHQDQISVCSHEGVFTWCVQGLGCHTVFQDTFRKMYVSSSYVEALTPMLEDGGHWMAGTRMPCTAGTDAHGTAVTWPLTNIPLQERFIQVHFENSGGEDITVIINTENVYVVGYLFGPASRPTLFYLDDIPREELFQAFLSRQYNYIPLGFTGNYRSLPDRERTELGHGVLNDAIRNLYYRHSQSSLLLVIIQMVSEVARIRAARFLATSRASISLATRRKIRVSVKSLTLNTRSASKPLVNPLQLSNPLSQSNDCRLNPNNPTSLLSLDALSSLYTMDWDSLLRNILWHRRMRNSLISSLSGIILYICQITNILTLLGGGIKSARTGDKAPDTSGNAGTNVIWDLRLLRDGPAEMEEIRVLEEAKGIGLPNFLPQTGFLTVLNQKSMIELGRLVRCFMLRKVSVTTSIILLLFAKIVGITGTSESQNNDTPRAAYIIGQSKEQGVPSKRQCICQSESHNVFGVNNQGSGDFADVGNVVSFVESHDFTTIHGSNIVIDETAVQCADVSL